jgi:hypothetical protein
VTVKPSGDLEAIVDYAQDEGVEVATCGRELEKRSSREEGEDGKEDLEQRGISMRIPINATCYKLL